VTIVTKVTLWGTSFAKLGDEAQLLAVATLLRSLDPDCDLALLSRRREEATRNYPDIRQIRLANLPGSIRRLAASDVVVVVGAPFFEHWRQALGCLFVFACAVTLRKPIVAYGVTIFDLKTRWGRSIYRRLLNRLEFIAVRERIAEGTLRRLGIHVPIHLIVDTRAVLNETRGERLDGYLAGLGIDRATPIICVTTRFIDENAPAWVKRDHQFTADHVRNADQALSMAAAELLRMAQLLVIPMHPDLEDDQAMTAMLGRQTETPERIHLLPKLSVTALIDLLGRSEMVISSRLSSTVFALSQATPTIALAYEPRQIDLMDRTGSPELAVDWRSLEAREFASMCVRVWDARQEIRTRLGPYAGHNTRRALQDSKLLLPYLRGT
jgi:polysaccharide pyruvyl transferase WcaK-like protein